MSDKIKIMELAELPVVADGDWIVIVDVSDTTQSPEGTTKRVRKDLLKGLNWRGPWVAGTYEPDDAVENEGSSWVCITDTTEEPSITATDWDLLALKGIDGTNIGDMVKTTYDPTNKNADAFSMDEMVEGANTKIMTAAERAKIVSLDAAVVLRGVWDASAGTFPGGGTAQAGDSYIVSVAGTVNAVSFAIGDRIIAILDNASTSTFANNWFKSDYTDQVLSVDSSTGAIDLGTILAAKAGKTTPVAADSFSITDSEASNVLKKLTLTNLMAFIASFTQTFTNKRITSRVLNLGSSATPAINTDLYDVVNITGLAVNITSMTSSLSGTPTDGQQLRINYTGTAARTITHGASFGNGPEALPNTTVTTLKLYVLYEYDGSVWRCMAARSTT